MDDPGYSRRDVPSQTRFAETELDACSEDGSERAYFMHQPGDLNYDDVESEVSASDPEGITAASSVVSGHFPGDAHDETWDLGPTDIKFAEPVSTPSKSPEKQEPEERRPVLSRVESLSSSFKDFEMERGLNADDEGAGHISSKVSESEYVADPEVIDFPVTVVDHADVELFRQNRHSPTSSLDVAAGSLAPSVVLSEPQHGTDGGGSADRGRRKAAKSTSLLKALATGRDPRENGAPASAGSGGSGSTSGPERGGSSGGGAVLAPKLPSAPLGGGGGFSFPVTPPSDEPDQRLFTSWPSVRSSCTSEPVAISDDDNALPAEYADEEYSKYRLSSRSTSLAAQDFPSERKTTDGEASPPPHSPDGLSTSGNNAAVDAADIALEWEFKPPLMQEESREPSLEFSTPNSDDEGAGTPTAVSVSAGGSGEAGGSVAKGGGEDAGAGLEGGALDTHNESVSLAGELEAAATHVVLQPHRPPSTVAEEGADGGDAEGVERKGSHVMAHSIHFDTDDHEVEQSHDTADAQSEAVSVSTARDLQLPQPHAQEAQEPELALGFGLGLDQDPGVDLDLALQGRGSTAERQASDGAAAFSEPGSYDGDDADVDEPDARRPRPRDHVAVDELGIGLDEEGGLDVLADEHELGGDDDELGLGREEGEVEVDHGEEGETTPGAAEPARSGRPDSTLTPRYHMDEHGNVMYEYEPEYIDKKYEVFELRIIHRRHRTGFEETKDFPIRLNDLIAGRYQVMDFLGSAAFSRAVQALDVKTGQLVCLKIIKNNKDYFDQSLDEIKLLKYVNTMDPNDEYAIVRLYDFFYYKEHLFLVCELLRANLYEFQKYNKESGDELYFTNARIQRIARQALRSLAFLHSLGLIHSDLKPENILIKSYSRCEVKVIDLGSSCFITDQLSSYVQSRSYRAPEVILGLPYDYKVDVWSLGCILAELSSGFVLFQNDSLATLLARLEGILGPVPEWMLHKGRYAHRFYTRSGMLYERSATTQRYELLLPKRTSLRHRMPDADEGLLEFVAHLLTVDPRKRPTAAEALKHPWLQQEYPSLDA
ncbi:hypothetical protein HYH03_010746 [Edaphochlamys debaryana]|uniref:Protein kinase domain-containing protein n=1 Tax=Edaphochlamys debaryana TaxID=47281 RepID=A0A836BVW1_9CHLO|nr:hypothetical protein HYH03_010746 [Edaphochlamys debaryana]|eukprot:KAG2490825.1 hypothetical protein HYH03_010746 [Edaphochlamys debaryana]